MRLAKSNSQEKRLAFDLVKDIECGIGDFAVAIGIVRHISAFCRRHFGAGPALRRRALILVQQIVVPLPDNIQNLVGGPRKPILRVGRAVINLADGARSISMLGEVLRQCDDLGHGLAEIGAAGELRQMREFFRYFVSEVGL